MTLLVGTSGSGEVPNAVDVCELTSNARRAVCGHAERRWYRESHSDLDEWTRFLQNELVSDELTDAWANKVQPYSRGTIVVFGNKRFDKMRAPGSALVPAVPATTNAVYRRATGHKDDVRQSPCFRT